MAEITYKLKENVGSSNQFIAYDGDVEAAEITFVNTGETAWIIDHTSVEDAYRGRNIGQELVKRVVDLAVERGKKIIPLCPFAKKEFDKNPEYQKLLVGR